METPQSPASSQASEADCDISLIWGTAGHMGAACPTTAFCPACLAGLSIHVAISHSKCPRAIARALLKYLRI